MQYVPKQDKQREEEHKLREERFRLDKEKKNKTKKIIIAASVAGLLIIAALTVYGLLSPGKYDGFAKCLAEKGAVMYGEDWCQYTQGQKAMFGKSFKYINYVQKPDLRIRPTWVINEKTYEKVQSFERLSALTGCEYRGGKK